jgi:hypothetical protein
MEMDFCVVFCALNNKPVTFPPAKTAPEVSHIAATIQASLRVRTLDPTDVPNELATSFAPRPNANMKAMIKPIITIHK